MNYDDREKEVAARVYKEVLRDPDYTFPRWWVEGDTLRFIHEFNFDEVEAVKVSNRLPRESRPICDGSPRSKTSS